ncbi:Demethylmenaquinone methyltransferase [Roseovarius albus]|uniref:Demethylmenaquinone methyltransferase n=1 Tax=Roseovarius albus TaxID=1247867 RepID=A0A1X6ZNB7_9RHOB|nr:class I SAM-dependent methyltransferase [Roseovarius albus]SLN56487.1 Demethylmenaquinone methyltransferase [Roseovarius albus]
MTTTAKFWDGIAAKYSRTPIQDMESYEYTLGWTRSYLSEQDKILELGCGTGSTALLLAPSVSHVTASDYSEAMLDIGREKAKAEGAKNISFETLDITKPENGQTFDVILGFNLFHLVPDIDAVFADIHARLAPDGLFISKTPCLSEGGLGLKFGLLKLMLPVMQLFGKAPYVNLFRVETLESAVTSAGFDVIRSGNYPAKPPSRYLVARKK